VQVCYPKARSTHGPTVRVRIPWSSRIRRVYLDRVFDTKGRCSADGQGGVRSNVLESV
jgi:hypothetical protein